MSDVKRIVLIGFSGTGKTTVARLLAESLGWDKYDTDDELERAFGITVPAYFAEYGEAAFRVEERKELASALSRGRVVIATGGGAAVDPAAWEVDLLGKPETLVVALDAAPETMLARLREQQQREGAATERPMIAGEDPLSRIEALKARRQEVYDRADITLIVDNVSPETVRDEILSLLPASDDEPTIRLQAGSGDSDVFVSPGAVFRIGELARQRWKKAGKAWIVSDEAVGVIHGSSLLESLQAHGFESRLFNVPRGEGSKSLATAAILFDWMLDGGIERSDIVVALGGGVVGDLAGFVAATVLRGVGLVQVPTTMVSVVDSSIGGKTAVNHHTGKNLIGVFYQPALVIVDPDLLQTLPERELVQGWGEVIKHAVIQPTTPGGDRADQLRFLERNAARLIGLKHPALTYLIRRNVALKAAVVEADEKESGIRAYLNFGHTLGHAFEAASYRYFHGEAIAVGMRAALEIGVAMETIRRPTADRIERLIERFGLPRTVDVEPERVLELVLSDKKRIAGTQRWVLPLESGGVEIRDDVPEGIVRHAVDVVREHRGE
jgi:shikimate kinase/3-dehydroquinate synthase